jgi:YCII-related domain
LSYGKIGYLKPLYFCSIIKQLKKLIMEKQKEFMLLFSFEPNSSYQPTEAHQLGFEGKQIAADKSVTEGINIANNKTLGGNMIVKANSLDEAVLIAQDCPILQMGGSVEVRSINPM